MNKSVENSSANIQIFGILHLKITKINLHIFHEISPLIFSRYIKFHICCSQIGRLIKTHSLLDLNACHIHIYEKIAASPYLRGTASVKQDYSFRCLLNILGSLAGFFTIQKVIYRKSGHKTKDPVVCYIRKRDPVGLMFVQAKVPILKGE